MDEKSIVESGEQKENTEEEVKWDYTNPQQTLFIGAIVVGLNLLVVLAVILDKTVPAAHSFITGKPL